jgi:hypothetical protein
MMGPLEAIGFWRSTSVLPDFLLPHPRELVDPDWCLEERRLVASYLRGGASLRGYLGYGEFRFPEGPEHLGTDDLTDGTWVWPEGLEIYVADHAVRLPDAFLCHAQTRHYQPPMELDAVVLRRRRVSFRHWLNWSARHRSNRFLAMVSIFVLPLY